VDLGIALGRLSQRLAVVLLDRLDSDDPALERPLRAQVGYSLHR
jgi:hypothetical protein